MINASRGGMEFVQIKMLWISEETVPLSVTSALEKLLSPRFFKKLQIHRLPEVFRVNVDEITFIISINLGL